MNVWFPGCIHNLFLYKSEVKIICSPFSWINIAHKIDGQKLGLLQTSCKSQTKYLCTALTASSKFNRAVFGSKRTLAPETEYHKPEQAI